MNSSKPKIHDYVAYLSPSGRLLPSTIRSGAGNAGAALLRTGIKYRGIAPETCKLVRVTVSIDGAPAQLPEPPRSWDREAAALISNYLTLGPHHSTPQAQAAIAEIILSCAAWPTAPEPPQPHVQP